MKIITWPMKKLNEPPRLAIWFLHWFCASHLLEEIEGDLLELYHERVTHRGKLKARLFYLADVLKLCRPFFCGIFYPNPTVFVMELKKHPSADLRRKYTLFLSIGLLISLALITTAFEWKTYDSIVIDIQSIISQDAEIPEIIPATIIPPPVVFDELPPEEPETMDFILVEKQPSFEEGMKAFYQYIAQHLEYPKQAIRIGREGKVFVSFVIDNDGSIIQVEVLKGIGAGCDEEAVRVLQNPPFTSLCSPCGFLSLKLLLETIRI